MKYDFDKIHDRSLFNSVKWNGMGERFGGRDDLLPLWVADMDFQSPQPVIDILTRAAEHGIYGYTKTSDSCYDAIISWMKKRHSWNIQREWINFAPGVVSAIGFIIRTFTHPGDKIIIQPPVYHPFAAIITKNGCKILNNPLLFENNRYSIDFDDLEKKVKDPQAKLLILSNPHNPVGRVWQKEELNKLGNLCLENNVLIISDEIHSDLIYSGFKHIPFASISEEFERICIVCTAPSKTFNLAGLKTSIVIIPNKEMFEAYDDFIDSLHLKRNNYFGVFALEYAYKYGEEWLGQLLQYLSGNISFLKDYLAKHVPAIKVIEPEGMYLVWLDFRSLNLNPSQLDDLLLNKAKVALNDGPTFGVEGQGFKRINIGCPRLILKEALEKIKFAINEMNKEK